MFWQKKKSVLVVDRPEGIPDLDQIVEVLSQFADPLLLDIKTRAALELIISDFSVKAYHHTGKMSEKHWLHLMQYIVYWKFLNDRESVG